jgi:hypothetical protein
VQALVGDVPVHIWCSSSAWALLCGVGTIIAAPVAIAAVS